MTPDERRALEKLAQEWEKEGGPTHGECAFDLLATLDRLTDEQSGERYLQERYWCGCVRHARWERCVRHKDLDHDEEPKPRRPTPEDITGEPTTEAEEVVQPLEGRVQEWLYLHFGEDIAPDAARKLLHDTSILTTESD